MNHRTTIRRLTKVADHLEQNVSRDNFLMGFWHVTNDCGTAACAWGHACLIPSFRRAGLKLKRNGKSIFGMPSYLGLEGFDGASEFLGITDAQAKYLFDPLYYAPKEVGKIRPIDVARRIRKLVKELERDYRHEMRRSKAAPKERRIV